MDPARISPRIRAEMRKTYREFAIVAVAAVVAFTAIGLGQAGVNEWWAKALMVASIIVLHVMHGIDRARMMIRPPPLTKPPGERRRHVARLREDERSTPPEGTPAQGGHARLAKAVDAPS